MDDDPYAASHLDPAALAPAETITSGIIEALVRTKPWVRFCSVIGFMSSAFMFLAALVVLLMDGMLFAGLGFLMTAIYLIVGILYLFPSTKLWKYASTSPISAVPTPPPISKPRSTPSARSGNSSASCSSSCSRSTRSGSS